MKVQNGTLAVNRNGVHLLNGNGVTTLCNSSGDVSQALTGYQYTIQTTTQIMAQVIKQKFYEVPFADYIPVAVGNGAGLESIRTNLEYIVAGDFSNGYINNASGDSRTPTVDIAIGNKNAVIKTWRGAYKYTVIETMKAAAAINYDAVSGKMGALKKIWDLGIQKMAFLGELSDLSNVPGLLNNSDITIDAGVTIPKAISNMDPTEFSTFVSLWVAAYFANSNRTVRPNTAVLPMYDFLGLQNPVSPTYPMITKMDYLQNALDKACQAKVEIIPSAYAEKAVNAGYTSTLGNDRYYRKEAETLRLDIPIDFTLLAPGTQNNFDWSGIAYGQHTGCVVYRPREVMYFDLP